MTVARLPLRTSTDTSPKVAEALADLEARGRAMPILRSVANAEQVVRSFLRYSGNLMFGATLPPRARELMVLRMAVRTECPYEWSEHEGFARAAGLSDVEIDALAAGERPSGLPDLEASCLDLVDQMVPGPADQARLDELAAALGPELYAEGALAIAWWAGNVPLLVELFGL